MNREFTKIFLLISLVLIGDAWHARTIASASDGAIVVSAYRSWRWDLYILDARGDLLKRLTFGEGDNRAPSWSPDGTRIAFESNRERNWDIYLIGTDGAGLKRLTTRTGFDGSPRWSPDGTRIAFTSNAGGDLDIWVMDADGAGAINLTPKSPSPDYDPVWSPDGKWIAFTSLRDANKEIYVMNADGSNLRNLTRSKPSDEEHPAWSPDGARIAFISEQDGARELRVLDAAAPQTWQRLTALQYHQWPVWSPDGSSILFVAQSEAWQSLQMVMLEGHRVTEFAHDRLRYRQPDWNSRASVARDEESLKRQDAPLYIERVTPNPPDHADRYNFVPLANMKMSLPSMVSDTVDDSYAALRQRVLRESGWDFLGSLSEAYRPLSFKSDASDYLSWHKAGRAVDLLWDYYTAGGRTMELAREDILAETYWRVYLRAAKQDGSMGEPLRQNIWDVSATTRARVGGRGGLAKGVLQGYYVDFTELAQQYGWRRIASHTKPGFDWRSNFHALEYWHYQKTDDLLWWDAIREVYPPKDLGDLFTYGTLTRQKYNLLTMSEKGVPLPPDVVQRYNLMEP